MMTMTKIMIVVLNQRPATIGCRRHFKLFKRTLHRGYNHDDRDELFITIVTMMMMIMMNFALRL